MTTSSGYVDNNGARIYYEVEGEGPDLTLIHAGVAHLRMWDAQVAAWSDRYRVIRYDTRGFGRTTCEDVPYSNVDDLRAVLDALGVGQTHLLGLSRGGMIALDFSVAHPDRVRSLVWVAGGVRGLDVADDPRLEALLAGHGAPRRGARLGAAGRARDAGLDRRPGPAGGPGRPRRCGGR